MELATSPEKEPIPEGKAWPQYLAAGLGSLTMLCTGTVLSWASPGLPHLRRGGLSGEQASWVGAATPLGAVAGSLCSGRLADLLGRRRLLLLLAAPYLLGWALVALAGFRAPLLCAGRLVSGLSTGVATVALAIYSEEISEVRVRGRLGCLLDFMIATGFLVFYVLQSCLGLGLATALCAATPVVFFCSFVWMPESPVHLLRRGQDAQAAEALGFLRGAGHDVAPELRAMRDYLDDKFSVDGPGGRRVQDCLFRGGGAGGGGSNTAVAARISIGLAVVAQLTGIQPVNYNTVDIFRRGRSSVDADTADMIYSSGQCLAALAALLLVDSLGRRVVLLTSAAGMLLSALLLCAHSSLKDGDGYIVRFGWVPCFAVSTFTASNGFGLGPVPWFVMAELSPAESKGWISSTCVCVSWVFQFATAKVYSVMTAGLGDALTFAVFAATSLLAVLFVALAVPETRGKTRAQIQRELQARGQGGCRWWS